MRAGVMTQRKLKWKKMWERRKERKRKGESEEEKRYRAPDPFPFIFYIACKMCSGKSQELSGNLLQY